jgi:hypothetical protein
LRFGNIFLSRIRVARTENASLKTDATNQSKSLIFFAVLQVWQAGQHVAAWKDGTHEDPASGR